MAFNGVALSAPTPDLTAALETAGLPTDDLREPGRRFYRFEDDAGLIGYGGLQQVGSDTLIRVRQRLVLGIKRFRELSEQLQGQARCRDQSASR